MPTIQIRDVPEDEYEVLRTRARRAGQSLQAYMRNEVVALARQPSKEEALEQIAAWLEQSGGLDLTPEEIVASIHDGRR